MGETTIESCQHDGPLPLQAPTDCRHCAGRWHAAHASRRVIKRELPIVAEHFVAGLWREHPGEELAPETVANIKEGAKIHLESVFAELLQRQSMASKREAEFRADVLYPMADELASLIAQKWAQRLSATTSRN